MRVDIIKTIAHMIIGSTFVVTNSGSSQGWSVGEEVTLAGVDGDGLVRFNQGHSIYLLVDDLELRLVELKQL